MKKSGSSTGPISLDRKSTDAPTSPRMVDTPRTSYLFRRNSAAVLQTSEQSSNIDSKKKSLARRHSWFNRKTINSSSPDADKNSGRLEKLKRLIFEQCAELDKTASEKLSTLEEDLAIVKFLLENYSELNDLIITQRHSLSEPEQEELDIFIYQELPPHLIYLYCKALIQAELSPLRCNKSDWLTTLIKNSLPGKANTLIYIATLLELARENSTPEVSFREDSLANFISACYVKARASDYVDKLVTEAIQCMREQPHWPQGYIINSETTLLTQQTEKNFEDLIATLSKTFTSVEPNPTVSSILTLRYDLTLQCHNYNTTIASTAANSLLWLRLFLPQFRMQPFSEEEQPVIKTISTLLVKASSSREFQFGGQQSTNKLLNRILHTHLYKDCLECFNKITAKKSNIFIYNFKNNTWVLWKSLLASSEIELSLTQLDNVSSY